MAEERWTELPLPEGVQGAVCQKEDAVSIFVSDALGQRRRAVCAQLHQKAQSPPSGPGTEEDATLMQLCQEVRATRAALHALLEEEEADRWQQQGHQSNKTEAGADGQNEND